MSTVTVDVGRLQKMTERGRKKAESRSRRERLTEDQKLDREAKKIAGGIIRDLPYRIKSAARKGESSVDVDIDMYYRSGSPMLGRRIEKKITAWCCKNNLSTSEKSVRYDDDGPLTNYLVVSWEKKK